MNEKGLRGIMVWMKDREEAKYKRGYRCANLEQSWVELREKLKGLEKESRAKLESLDPDRMWWKAVELFNDILGPEAPK